MTLSGEIKQYSASLSIPVRKVGQLTIETLLRIKSYIQGTFFLGNAIEKCFLLSFSAKYGD